MVEEYKKDPEPGTELGRSPSGVPGSEGARSAPLGTPGADGSSPVESENPWHPESETAQEGDELGLGCPGAPDDEAPLGPPPLCAWRRGGALRKKSDSSPRKALGPTERLLVLDTWRRSGLPAGDFSALVGISRHTLYSWKRRFEEEGPAGLMDRPRGPERGSKLPEVTRRAILMLKESNPQWGCERISHLLLRGPALPASPGAVARVLHEAGYELEEEPTRPHPDKPRHFERARGPTSSGSRTSSPSS
jgi:transposase